jgi:hypothetical protein
METQPALIRANRAAHLNSESTIYMVCVGKVLFAACLFNRSYDSSIALMSQELFELRNFGLCQIKIFLSSGKILRLQCCIAFRKVCFHSLLRRSDISPQPVAGGLLLLPQGIDTLRNRCSANIQLIRFILYLGNFFGRWSCRNRRGAWRSRSCHRASHILGGSSGWSLGNIYLARRGSRGASFRTLKRNISLLINRNTSFITLD